MCLSKKFGRKLFYYAYPDNNILISECGNEKYLVNTSDKIIGFLTFAEKRAFESERVQIICDLLPKNHSKDLLIDVGANIGTIGISAIVNNQFKKCIAFEPEPLNFKLLSTNVTLNSIENRMTAYNLALSNQSHKSLEFELSKENHGDHRVRGTTSAGLFNETSRETIFVRSSCLDDYANDFYSLTTLIWMDTQGHEGYVLQGAVGVIKKSVPIVTEFWPYGLRRSGCYQSFLESFKNSSYNSITDLGRSGATYKFSVQTLIKIAEEIGFDGDHTDLLIM